MSKRCWVATGVLIWAAMSGGLRPSARAQQGRGYFWGEAGPAWSQNTELSQFAGEPVSGLEMEFDTGFRFGFGAGYNITDWAAAEFESGVLYNSMAVRGTFSDGDASVSHVPFLVNMVFRLPNSTGIVPYIGGGLGGDLSILNLEDFVIDLPASRTFADGSFSDVAFAYQGFAGVRYEFNENMALGLGYKYFGSQRASWEADTFVETGLPPFGGFWTTSRTDSGKFHTHTVTLTFTFTF